MKTFNDLASCLNYIAEKKGIDTLLDYEQLEKLLDEIFVLECGITGYYSYLLEPIFEGHAHLSIYWSILNDNNKEKAIADTLKNFMRKNIVRAYMTNEDGMFYEEIQDRYDRENVEFALRIYADALSLCLSKEEHGAD